MQFLMRGFLPLLLIHEYPVLDDGLTSETDQDELGVGLVGEAEPALAAGGRAQHEVQQFEGVRVGRGSGRLVRELQLVPIQHEAESCFTVVERFVVIGLVSVCLMLQPLRFLSEHNHNTHTVDLYR